MASLKQPQDSPGFWPSVQEEVSPTERAVEEAEVLEETLHLRHDGLEEDQEFFRCCWGCNRG